MKITLLIVDRIHKYIKGNPGCHLRQIKRELRIGIGTAQYQLERLEKSGKIISSRHGLYEHYFRVGILDEQEKILRVLGRETDREILMFIIERGNPTQTEISTKIMISPASVKWHIRKLMELDLIKEDKEGKYNRYLLQGDSSAIVSMLKSYYPTIWEAWSNRLAEIFLWISRGEEL